MFHEANRKSFADRERLAQVDVSDSLEAEPMTRDWF